MYGPVLYIDGLVQEKCNSIAIALELRLSCTNPSIYLVNVDPHKAAYTYDIC